MIGPVWRVPAVLALLSAAGLVIGLMRDGLWDAMASLALVLPLLLAWAAGRRASPRRQTPPSDGH